MKCPLAIQVCVTLSFVLGSLALTSICPTIFQYKTTTLSAREYQSWSGVLHLQNHYNNGPINVDIILDRTATYFSAHQFDIMTSDGKKYHLSFGNQSNNAASQAQLNRIYMTVDFEGQTVPLVDEIRFNGIRICPEATTPSPGLNHRQTTRRPYQDERNPNSRETFGGPGGATTERINSLTTSNNRHHNSAYDGVTARTNPTTTIRQIFHSPTVSTGASRDSWNLNNNRETTNTPRRSTTTTTTSSPYFAGDLHMIFQNGNDRRRSTENPLASEQQCGILSPSLNPLVVNGMAAQEGQFPWHAALYISQGVQLKYTCGGNLISTRLILTAAHCVTLKRTQTAMNPEHLLVYLGKSDLLHWQGHEQDSSVEEIMVHPQYNSTRFYSDMALLRLKKAARYTDHVRPVCLWSSEDLKQLVGRVGRVPGWGYNENGVVGTELSYVEMPVVTHETCIWSNREVFSRITSESSFCAGFRNGSNVCNGDSGGGMVFYQGGRWSLKGIVSVSVAIQNHFLCDPDHYVVFGDVSKYKSWIEEYL